MAVVSPFKTVVAGADRSWAFVESGGQAWRPPALCAARCKRTSPSSSAPQLQLGSKLATDGHALWHCSSCFMHGGDYRRSKSSSLSRYFIMFRLILDESTQVTKSSRLLYMVSHRGLKAPNWTLPYLDTRNAESVTTSVPTLTCPCSMNLFAALTVSAMRSLVITTPSRLRQNAETVIFLSTSLSLPLPPPPMPSKPMSCSFSSNKSSCFRRNCDSGGRSDKRCARCRKEPARRL